MMRRFLTTVKVILLAYAISLSVQTGAAESVPIAVFDQHQRYINASKPYALSWKLVDAAAQSQGIILEPVESSWRAAISRLKGGRIPLVFAAFKTPDREQWATFTLPLAPDNSAIFALPANPVARKSDIDLNTASIGVSTNSVQERFARELGFKNIYSTNERSQLYDMLEEGRLDYLFFGQSMIGYYCLYYANSGTRDCMKQVGEPYDFNQVHAMALKGQAQSELLVHRINQGLMAIAASQPVEQWFAEEGFTRQDFARWERAVQSHRNVQSN